MNWNAFSAIATSSAVFVALFMPFYLNRRKMKVMILNAGRFSKEKNAPIAVENHGAVPFHICRILFKNQEGKLKELNQEFDLPKIVKPGEVALFSSSFLSHNLKEVKTIYIENAYGRKKKVKTTSLRNAKKIEKYYIGKRFIYESMGDIVDENKLK